MKAVKEKHSGRIPRNRLPVIYVLIMIVTCAAIVAYSSYIHFCNLSDTAADVTASLNKETEIAVKQYMQKLENLSAVALTKDNYMDYDASDTQLDKYRAAQIESEMTNYLTSFSLLDNYCDFAIIYRNDSHAGKLSSVTEDLLEPDMFQTLKNGLDGKKTAWVCGINDDYNRIYYLREVHDHAIFVGSFYTNELSGTFIPKGRQDNAELFLTDSSGRIIYSHKGKEGGMIDPKYIDQSQKSGYTLINYDMIESVSVLDCGWKIITVNDMRESHSIYVRTDVICLGIVLFSIAVIAMISIVAAPAGSAYATKKSSTDGLTGLYTAEVAENLIADKIETCISGSTILLALVKINNLDLISENYGTAGVSEALLKVSGILTGFYAEDPDAGNVVGRAGKNEFVVFADFTEYDLFKAHDKLKESLKEISRRLEECELDSGRGMVKCSIGAAVYPDISTDYDELYESAGEALKEAEENDGNYVLYKNETTGREKV